MTAPTANLRSIMAAATEGEWRFEYVNNQYRIQEKYKGTWVTIFFIGNSRQAKAIVTAMNLMPKLLDLVDAAKLIESSYASTGLWEVRKAYAAVLEELERLE